MQSFKDPMNLADWRRRVAELYAVARASADPVVAWQKWQSARDRLFREHPQSPLTADQRARFSGLAYFDYDPGLRFVVDLDSVADDIPRSWNLRADGVISLQPVARSRGLAPVLGAELTLFWIAGYGGGIFLPFADATAGLGTYGGGRYLLDGIKGADLGATDGRVVLDFNFAYNPSCAYSPRWTCPLAPPENRLPAAVRAGELAPEIVGVHE